MSVSVSTTAGNQVTVTVDGATQLSFTTQDSSISVVNGDTSSISVTNQGPKGDTGATGATGATGQGVPAGGDQFQVLRKVDGDDYNTEWDYADRVTIEVRFDEAVSKGDPLYITGYNNGQNRITVAKADASDSAKMPSIGLAFSDYSQNDNGKVTSIGSLEDIDTQVTYDFQEGDVVYVASGGGLTNVKPTGTNLIQNVGKVGRRQQNNGEIVVMAIGRSNDVPNIPDGQIWIGNASGVATPTAFGIDLDTTPQLGGDLDVNGNKIVSASNGDIVIDPNGTGAIIFKSDDIQFDGDGGLGTGKIRLYEPDLLGSNFIALAAPLSVTSDTTLTLPDGAGSSGQVLSTNGNGALSWVDVISSANPDFTGYLDIRSAGANQGTLFLYDSDDTNYVSLGVPEVLSSNLAFTLPATDGSANQVLKTDGSGRLSFVDQTADTNTNLGNSDQTLSAERTIELSGNALIIDNNSAQVAKIYSQGFIEANGRVIVTGNGVVPGLIRLYDTDSSHYVGFKSPSVVSSNLEFTLPDSDGSSGQVLKTDGSGNLSFGDPSNKITQLFNLNFFDDISTIKHYLPWKDINEQSQNYQDESAMLMPYDGRIVSISLKMSFLNGDGDITLGIESIPTGSSPYTFPGSWTIEETETLSATSTDDHHTFHFVFDNASHFEAGDTVAISIKTSADIMGNSYIHATAVVEFDTSGNLGSSSTEYDSNP